MVTYIVYNYFCSVGLSMYGCENISGIFTFGTNIASNICFILFFKTDVANGSSDEAIQIPVSCTFDENSIDISKQSMLYRV